MQIKLTVFTTAAMVLILGTFGASPASAQPCDATVSEGESIQSAIDAAPADNQKYKICVKPGVYTEDLEIFRDKLELAGSGFPTIEGFMKGDTDDNPFPTAVPNINIEANDVSIHNFTIRSPEITDATEYASGIVLSGTDIEIFKNHFEILAGTPGSQAIQTWALTSPMGLTDISGLEIYKNKFTCIGNGIGFGCEAIFINPQTDPVPTNGKQGEVLIEKNTFSGELYRAIGIQRDKVVANKNKMSTDLPPQPTIDFGDVPWGIKVFDGFDGTNVVELLGTVAEKNKIGFGGGGNFNVGIRLESMVTDATVDKNYIKNPEVAGISVAGSLNTVVSNRVKGSNTDGIFVENGATGNDITRNNIKSTGVNGIFVQDGATGNDVIRNNVKGSGTWDIIDEGAFDNNYVQNNCKTSDPGVICNP